MSANPDTEPQTPADKPEDKALKPSFWASFTAADMRTLVVTIAGTVIGGILVVMVVALAVGVDRWESLPAHNRPATWPQNLVIAGGIIALLIAGAAARRIWARKTGASAEDPQYLRTGLWIYLLPVLTVGAVFWTLTLLGKAAGVK